MLETPREKEAKEFKEVASILKKIQKESSNKAPKKITRMPKRRSSRMMAYGLKPDYCEFKKRIAKKEMVIEIASDNNKEEKSKDSSSKTDKEIEVGQPNWGIFVDKESNHDENEEKSQGSMDTLDIQKVIEEEIERTKEVKKK